MSSQEHAERIREALDRGSENAWKHGDALGWANAFDSVTALLSVAEKAEALAEALEDAERYIIELGGGDTTPGMMPCFCESCACYGGDEDRCDRGRALLARLAAFGSGEGDTDA